MSLEIKTVQGSSVGDQNGKVEILENGKLFCTIGARIAYEPGANMELCPCVKFAIYYTKPQKNKV